MLTNGYRGGEHTVCIRTDTSLMDFKRLRRKSKEQMQEFTVPRAATKIRVIQQSDGVRRFCFHH